MSRLAIGKLAPELLADLLERHVRPDGRVLAGPGIGIDAAVLELDAQHCLVAKTDPITYATDRVGWYAVHVSANDVACCAATPRWFLATVLLPGETATQALAEEIFRQIGEACLALQVAWCGGHTEIVAGLPRPIVVGQMLGEVTRQGWITAGGALRGDRLILTKGIAIEGTALIAREKRPELVGMLTAAELDRSAGLLDVPGISVVRDARIALETGGVHALHDPTESGVAGGIWELAQASGLGVAVDEQRLSILPECAVLCRHYGLDPLGLIASGALLVAAAPDRAAEIVARLQAAGIAAAEIGRLLPAEEGRTLRDGAGRSRPLPTFASDEITRLFS